MLGLYGLYWENGKQNGNYYCCTMRTILQATSRNLICGIAGIDGKHYKEYSIMWYDIA